MLYRFQVKSLESIENNGQSATACATVFAWHNGKRIFYYQGGMIDGIQGYVGSGQKELDYS